MRSLELWSGRTPDTPIPDRVRARIFLKFNGHCAECGRKLRPGHWQADHKVAIINGGTNDENNLVPLCISPCHSGKTKADVAEKSKVYRIRNRAIGIKKKRTITRWRRFDGSIVEAKRER